MLHTTNSPPPTPRDVKTKLAETSSGPETPPPAKRLKHTPEETKIAASDYHHANPDVTKTTKGSLDSNDVPQTPVNVVSRGCDGRAGGLLRPQFAVAARRHQPGQLSARSLRLQVVQHRSHPRCELLPRCASE